ncbi:MAG: crossover junction endodeoxyribonuclease RuvC [Clostridia bacterium]|nr:crossover junction endodeoxyribonuclease RuvC [Clostridia bacterium]
MIIMGIDPGLATQGVGIIRYENQRFAPIWYGAVLTKAGLPLPTRLTQIFDDTTQIIEKFRPDVVAMEELFFNTNTTTAFAVAQARGCAVLAAAKQGLEVFTYTPLQVKQAVTGYGRADKPQVQQMVRALLHLNAVPKPDDVADALAVAVCHAHSHSPFYEGRR